MPKPLPKLAFSYPRRGLEGRFNTFRLGVSCVDSCRPGREVELVDARSGKVLKRAVVETLHIGLLIDMASLHADAAHNWKDHPVRAERPGLLIASMKKRYPPNRVRDDSVVTVVYLTEVKNETVSNP